MERIFAASYIYVYVYVHASLCVSRDYMCVCMYVLRRCGEHVMYASIYVSRDYMCIFMFVFIYVFMYACAALAFVRRCG